MDSWDIGRAGDSTPNAYFNGQLDDVKIWNYALSAAQIKKEFNEGGAVRYGP